MKKPIIIIFLVLLLAPVFSQNGRSQKRGIAYGYHSLSDLAAISEGTCWWYNWSIQPESRVASTYQDYNMDFVPMAWNALYDETKLKTFYKTHPNAKYLLAFNEPNFTSQANMTPKQAAAAWPKLEAIADTFNLEIVGPAVNYCDQCLTIDGVKMTSPIAYIDSFFAACPDCRVDYIAVHNYMCYSGALSDYIDDFKKYGKKIWLTEFACWDQATITLAMQKSYLKSAIDYLENDTMIFRYSWFTGNRSGAFPYLDIYAPQTGKLTELGQFYVDYRAYVPDTSFYVIVPDRIEAEHFTSMNGTANEVVTDFDGEENVGYIDANDWLEYNINLPENAEYYLYFRIASTASSSIILQIDGVNADTLKFTSTGGWQSWKTLSLQTILPAGKHKLRAFTPTGKFNLNWIRISDHANTIPVISAGEDQVINIPQNSTSLIASCSDNEGDGLRYKWSKISGPACTIESPTQANTVVTGLVKGKYTFNLTVSDSTEIVSDKIVVDVIFATDIESTKNERYILYPNPVENILFIKNSGAVSKTEISVCDPAGRQLIRKMYPIVNEELQLDVSSLNKGYYIIKISSENETKIQSIIKI